MFRFAIRDLLWLMVVVGMALAWWMERAKDQNELALLRPSHGNLQEIRGMLGSDQKLDELINMAKFHNYNPKRPNTLVITIK